MANPVTTAFETLSDRSRERKARLLRQLIDTDQITSLLDVGGEIDARNEQAMDLVPDSAVTVVNIDPQHLDRVRSLRPEVTTDLQDARKLPYADDAFDLVYSNAVIEHVGDFDDQRRMAEEVRRVGRQWFVTTPNRWFPFEFHTRLPFVSWLPAGALQRVAETYSYNHVERRYQSNQGGCGSLQLLSARQMQELFPDSLIIRQRVTAWPETIIAVGPRASLRR